jgi:hypothetical protein
VIRAPSSAISRSAFSPHTPNPCSATVRPASESEPHTRSAHALVANTDDSAVAGEMSPAPPACTGSVTTWFVSLYSVSMSWRSSTAAATLRKIEWVRDGAGARFGHLELEIGAYFITITDQPEVAAAASGSRFGVGSDEILTHPHALIGTVDSICDTLRQRRDELGISYFTIGQRHLDEFAPVVARLAGT